MTTLRDGTVIDESIDAVHVTRAADVPAVFRLGPRIVTSITIHHWGAFGQDFDQVVGYLSSDNPRQSSAHTVAKAGRVSTIVSPEDAAWHAGSAVGNTTSVGVECHPEATDADYVTVAAYVAYIRSLYGDIPLVPHNHWINTDCPGGWDLDRLDTLARGVDVPVEKPAPAPVIQPTSSTQPVENPVDNGPLGDNQCRVEANDTLTSIAKQFNVSLDDLIRVNGITDPNKIFVGEILDLPVQQEAPVTQVQVSEGDTLSGIAVQWNTTVDRLIEANPGINPDLIYTGQTLNL